MKKFKNILAVYNDEIGTDDALTQAEQLARANDARLTLIDVCSPGYGSPAVPAEREKRLQRMVRSLHLEGITEVDVKVLIGTPFEKIANQVVLHDHDIVIATSESAGGFQNTLYGNLATQLMRKCPCPVWIVKPGQSVTYSRVLAAIDPDPADPANDPLCIKVMDMATSLAAAQGAELHVLHAWDVEGNDSVTIGSEVHDATRQRLLEKHEGQRRGVVDAVLQRYRVLQSDPIVHLPRGFPQWEIVNAVKARNIDLLVMGTTSRSGLLGLLIGNTAEAIMSAVGSGVLTVKPHALELSIKHEGAMAVA